MPFIKDAKTGLPGYTMPDIVEEQEEPQINLADAPQPSIYGEPGVTAAEVAEKMEAQAKYEEIVKAQDQSPDPRMYATLPRTDPAIFQREISLRMAHEARGTADDVIKRAEAYLAFLKGETELRDEKTGNHD